MLKRRIAAESVKKRIEQTPNINNLEMCWFRLKGNAEMDPIVRNRTEDSLERPYPYQLPKEYRTYIHTHPFTKNNLSRKACPFSMPSLLDISNFLYDAQNSKIRFHHIATVENGLVTGYFSLYASRKLLSSLYKGGKKIGQVHDILRRHFSGGEKTGEIKKAIEILKELGLRTSVKPMPGYVFDGVKFVASSKSKPE